MDNPTVRVSITLPTEIKTRVSALAQRQKRSFSNTIAVLIESQLDKLDFPELPEDDSNVPK